MKPAATEKTAIPEAAPEAVFRILKIATAPSLSGKSRLTYHIGCRSDSEVLLRVYANSSTGYFSKEWVALNAIQQLLAKAPQDGTLTSTALIPLFEGKSINTPPFLFAALLNEGLVKPSTTTKRCYECTDGKAFQAQIKALIASKVDLKEKVQKVETKAATNLQATKQQQAEDKKLNAVDKKLTAKDKKLTTVPSQKPAAPAKKSPSKPVAKK